MYEVLANPIQYVESKSKEDKFSVRNPQDDSLVVENVSAAGEADVDAAVEAATKAYKEWRKWSGQARAKCMLKMADLIDVRLASLFACLLGSTL